MSERSEIDRMQRELGDEQSKLNALRSQHAASQEAHATATRERQALLLAHQIAQEKAAEADRKVSEVEDRISALSEPIAAQEARVSQLAAELAKAVAQEVEGKAQEADAHAVALEHAIGNLKPVMTEFVNACRAAGAVVPDSMGMGRTNGWLRMIRRGTDHEWEQLRTLRNSYRQALALEGAQNLIPSDEFPQEFLCSTCLAEIGIKPHKLDEKPAHTPPKGGGAM